ncbi:hypothetical protein ACIHDR_46105 [Nocardia sp. NPDC052278]|uniref:hypothetical protein n=1 Tax=unclassified Nocardia TaxID=2637762 RepID=UPI0036A25827
MLSPSAKIENSLGSLRVWQATAGELDRHLERLVSLGLRRKAMQHKIVLRAMLQIAVRHGAVETNRPTASAHSPLSAPMNTLIARDIRAARAAGYCAGLDPESAASALDRRDRTALPHLAVPERRSSHRAHRQGRRRVLWQLWGHAVYWTDPLTVSTSDE